MPLSRQRCWQAKRHAEGRCVTCGKPRQQYSHHCDNCYAKHLMRCRKRLGSKPWGPGGRGRPPTGAVPSWTPEQDRLVRKLRPREAAKRLGRPIEVIYQRRAALRRMGCDPGRLAGSGRPPAGAAPLWTPEEDRLVRELRPREAAKRLGKPVEAIYQRRAMLRLKDELKRESPA